MQAGLTNGFNSAGKHHVFFPLYRGKKKKEKKTGKWRQRLTINTEAIKQEWFFFVYLKIGGIIKHLNCFIAPSNFMGTARKLKWYTLLVRASSEGEEGVGGGASAWGKHC